MSKFLNGVNRVINGLIFVVIFSAMNLGVTFTTFVIFGTIETSISFRIFYGLMTVAAFLLGADMFPRKKRKKAKGDAEDNEDNGK